MTIGPLPRPLPQGMLDPMPSVLARFDDGTEQELFRYCPDETAFSEAEFVGLTVSEAYRLWHRKDLEYLQSRQYRPGQVKMTR